VATGLVLLAAGGVARSSQNPVAMLRTRAWAAPKIPASTCHLNLFTPPYRARPEWEPSRSTTLGSPPAAEIWPEVFRPKALLKSAMI
jgi:hypothetical protein